MAVISSRVTVIVIFDIPATANQLTTARNQAHAALIAGGFAASDADINDYVIRDTFVYRQNGTVLECDIGVSQVKGITA